MSTTSSLASVKAPGWGLLSLEPLRAALEYAGMRLMNKTEMPPGDGHAVVIFPGLAADHCSIAPLKDFCAQLGYATYNWGRGLNTGPHGNVDDWIDDLAQHVLELTNSHLDQVSLLGWSLGGIYAREVAKKLGDRIRQVITIGTPFAGSPDQTNVAWIYRLLSGQDSLLDEALLARMRAAPDVPTTSIFSRSDGIVSWQACIQAGDAAHTENIEVDGSHCGLGWNPDVLAIIADRLQQPAGRWRRRARGSKPSPFPILDHTWQIAPNPARAQAALTPSSKRSSTRPHVKHWAKTRSGSTKPTSSMPRPRS